MEHTLHMPPSKSDPELVQVTTRGVVVVVGANGSGKSKLGAWIELDSQHRDKAHRVSAQRSLDMPTSSSPMALDEAEAELRYGLKDKEHASKRAHRWKSKPTTSLLSDFRMLVTYLFSEEFERYFHLKARVRESGVRADFPETKLDIIQRIWDCLLPNRELIIGSGRVQVRSKEKPDEPYNAQDASDGERVIFYLIGQCLAAPESSVIVIDEPVIHLHKAIQSDLWDAIEAERPDCLFVYLTHDLDFAASRVSAPKICLREYDGESWDWYLVPEDDGIPEEILLQILGSRKPILFTEGKEGSLDCFLFSYLYPEFTVVPCGGCEQVIHNTCAFAKLNHLHHLECRGIVDRDHRTDDEVAYLVGHLT